MWDMVQYSILPRWVKDFWALAQGLPRWRIMCFRFVADRLKTKF